MKKIESKQLGIKIKHSGKIKFNLEFKDNTPLTVSDEVASFLVKQDSDNFIIVKDKKSKKVNN